MPYQLHIIKAGDFIRYRGEGSIDFETSRRVLRSLAEAILAHGIDKAILDLRKVYGDPPATYGQLYQLARTFIEAGFGPSHRLAVLISPDRYDKAEFFAVCASGRGWTAWAFDDFEAAIDWLTEEVPIDPAPGP